MDIVKTERTGALLKIRYIGTDKNELTKRIQNILTNDITDIVLEVYERSIFDLEAFTNFSSLSNLEIYDFHWTDPLFKEYEDKGGAKSDFMSILIWNEQDLLDFSSLSTCMNLERVKIKGLIINNLTFFEGLRNLKTVHLHIVPADDIHHEHILEPLANCAKLENVHIYIGTNSPIDYSFISSLKKLRKVKIGPTRGRHPIDLRYFDSSPQLEVMELLFSGDDLQSFSLSKLKTFQLKALRLHFDGGECENLQCTNLA